VALASWTALAASVVVHGWRHTGDHGDAVGRGAGTCDEAFTGGQRAGIDPCRDQAMTVLLLPNWPLAWRPRRQGAIGTQRQTVGRAGINGDHGLCRRAIPVRGTATGTLLLVVPLLPKLAVGIVSPCGQHAIRTQGKIVGTARGDGHHRLPVRTVFLTGTGTLLCSVPLSPNWP